jgi:translation initiation factor 1 (eIF-1/SUI1)
MTKKPKPKAPGKVIRGATLTHSPFAVLTSKAPPIVAPAREPTPASEQRAKADPPAPAKKSPGRLVLRRETKHRGGKAVIVVTGFGSLRDFNDVAVDALAKELKRSLGCGGTVENDGAGPEIVLQGDRAAKVAELLRAKGFRVDGVRSIFTSTASS